MSESYTPDESAAQLYAEKTWLAGAIITGTGYGIVLALFWLCFRALWYRTKIKDASYRRNMFFLVYVFVMFVFGSLFIGSNSQFTQLAFINDRNFSGGPSAYEEQMFSIGVDEIGNVSFTLANWLADSLLVWRCVIIYRDCGTPSPWLVLAVTGLMQLASFALGILFLIQISTPASSPYFNADKTTNWTLPYFFVSLAINIIVTILIVLRLLFHRRRLIKVLGPGHASESTTVAAMIVESASVYSTFSLLFLIPFAMKSPVSNTFLQVIGEAQLIAPLLIIYREAQGKGWLSSTSSTASSTLNGEHPIRLGQFSDIRFTSRHARRQSTVYSTGEAGERTLDMGGVDMKEEEGIEEVSREGREEVELV
ncbi:hypothetical protein HYDPIDRAFT_132008 [Hydnomerulius pinastri MD-312]|uniref:Uncharacterized protein n=1 Tax=Hydnomerulius pinastri MD-312 TaxID=994086 RepID=A0A0C9WFH7_9AGAM|nr:hypothetical protein HYDPIDRAFT_132008 [Hydnomerulius pinastri MD-312]